MNSIESEKLPVMISVRGEQYYDGADPDSTELMTEGTLEQTADELEKLAQPGDMIITVGAGDIYRAGELLLKRGDAQ